MEVFIENKTFFIKHFGGGLIESSLYIPRFCGLNTDLDTNYFFIRFRFSIKSQKRKINVPNLVLIANMATVLSGIIIAILIYVINID